MGAAFAAMPHLPAGDDLPDSLQHEQFCLHLLPLSTELRTRILGSPFLKLSHKLGLCKRKDTSRAAGLPAGATSVLDFFLGGLLNGT